MIRLFFAFLLISCTTITLACPQTKAIILDNKLINALKKIAPDSSNAWQAEQIMGPACACLPLGTHASETWICQWKGDLSSNRLEKTLNISFSAGAMTQITAIDEKGVFIKLK